MHVLVVGSTGFLGTETCRRLIDRGHRVRGLVRATSDADRVAALRDMDVETVEGDLKEPPSLDAALDGIDTVVSTATTTRSRQEGEGIGSVDDEGQANQFDAASKAGVEHVVYISYSGNIGVDDPLTLAKRANEERLMESPMDYTILRPSCFMEAWLSPSLGFDYPNGSVTIYGTGENPVSWISMRDVAEFAARAVEDPALRNEVLELGGPEALSPLKVVRIFEEESGRSFQVQNVPEEALRQQEATASDPMERSFAALMLAYAKGDPIPMGEALERVPVELTSVRDYARAALSAS